MQLLKEKLKALREENLKLIEQGKSVSREKDQIEGQLVEAKMQWATLDMENDELAVRLKQKNEQLKIFSSQVTKLEIELVRAKQELGEALNECYEYEK